MEAAIVETRWIVREVSVMDDDDNDDEMASGVKQLR